MNGHGISSNDNIRKARLRRLQKLKEAAAIYGIDTPPHILTEIEDIERMLGRKPGNVINLTSRISLIIVLIVIAGASGFLYFRNNKSYDEYYKQGIEVYKKSDYDAAVITFTKAINLDPERSGAYEWRALSFLNQGKFDKAISDFNRALILSPGSEEIYYNRGLAYSKLGLYDNAISDYNHILDIKPEHALAHYWRGKAYRAKQLVDLAKADYQKCLELSENTDQSLAESCRIALRAYSTQP